MNTRWFLLAAVLLSALVLSGGCTSTTPASTPVNLQSPPGSTLQDQSVSQTEHPIASPDTLTLSVDSLSPGSALPAEYTCAGAGESPGVSWSGIPDGTKSLVLILEDPDAPQGIFTHWLVYNIPAQSGELGRGQTFAKVLSNGAQQGEGSSGQRGYYYPCPPVGSTHRYIFRLYALDEYLALPTADRAAIDRAIATQTIGKTEFVTTFTR